MERKRVKLFQNPFVASKALEKGSLPQSCTFVLYAAIQKSAIEKSAKYMNDNVIEKYENYSEEADI